MYDIKTKTYHFYILFLLNIDTVQTSNFLLKLRTVNFLAVLWGITMVSSNYN